MIPPPRLISSAMLTFGLYPNLSLTLSMRKVRLIVLNRIPITVMLGFFIPNEIIQTTHSVMTANHNTNQADGNHVFQFGWIARRGADRAGEVPERHCVVVGDEKSFAVHAVVGRELLAMGIEEILRGQDMRVRAILNVGPFEEVLAVVDLVSVFPCSCCCCHHRLHGYRIVFSEEAGKSQGYREHV